MRVRVERAGAVGRLTLARPEKKNALDRETAEELFSALRALGEDREARAILVDAEGDDFCAGADLDALAGMLDADEAAHRADAETLGRVFLLLRELTKPVVAAVRGRALAGGAGLATACDVVLAHEHAVFGYPEVRVGFVPAMVMSMLRRTVGEKRAFELVATGRTVSAREALEMGLVSRVYTEAEFATSVREMTDLLARAPRDALGLTKRLFYDLDALPFRDAIERGVRVNVEARATDDFRAGVRRFVRRREDR